MNFGHIESVNSDKFRLSKLPHRLDSRSGHSPGRATKRHMRNVMRSLEVGVQIVAGEALLLYLPISTASKFFPVRTR